MHIIKHKSEFIIIIIITVNLLINVLILYIDITEWFGLGTPCWRSQVRNPLPVTARGLPSGSSSIHRACLVWVTSPMWFASYCIGAGVLPCAHPKGSVCEFPLS